MSSESLAELLPRLFTSDSAGGGSLLSGTLSGLRKKPAPEADDETFRRADVKPVELKGRRVFQFEYKFAKKVTHRNLPPDEAAAHARELLADTFTQAVLRTSDAEYHLIHGKGEKWTIRRKAMAGAAQGGGPACPLPSASDGSHNRQKKYLLPEGEPVPFLIRLGVMTAEGKVVAARYDKFRQVNRFLEMVQDTLDALDTSRPLRVIDFGSGKSYLTFALYHLLREKHGLDVHIVGLDLKRDVIDQCNAIARDLDYQERLRFEVGDIAGYGGAGEQADMVVSLHACDTATDDALAKAVAWGASVILSVPCCQHELFKKIKSDPLRPLLKHGILKERLAALVTDALRAEMLEQRGYAVQVLEFIDLEHTPKNLLLRATRRRSPDAAHERRAASEYQAFRDFWNLGAPYIETAFPAKANETAD